MAFDLGTNFGDSLAALRDGIMRRIEFADQAAVVFVQQFAEKCKIVSPVTYLLERINHGSQLSDIPSVRFLQLCFDAAQSHVGTCYPGGKFDQVNFRVFTLAFDIIDRAQ